MQVVVVGVIIWSVCSAVLILAAVIRSSQLSQPEETGYPFFHK